jgi:hypothetical protein
MQCKGFPFILFRALRMGLTTTPPGTPLPIVASPLMAWKRFAMYITIKKGHCNYTWAVFGTCSTRSRTVTYTYIRISVDVLVILSIHPHIHRGCGPSQRNALGLLLSPHQIIVCSPVRRPHFTGPANQRLHRHQGQIARFPRFRNSTPDLTFALSHARPHGRLSADLCYRPARIISFIGKQHSLSRRSILLHACSQRCWLFLLPRTNANRLHDRLIPIAASVPRPVPETKPRPDAFPPPAIDTAPELCRQHILRQHSRPATVPSWRKRHCFAFLLGVTSSIVGRTAKSAEQHTRTLQHTRRVLGEDGSRDTHQPSTPEHGSLSRIRSFLRPAVNLRGEQCRQNPNRMTLPS